MPQLEWLKVHRFRNVLPDTELHFGRTFNVLLGKNATGKSTLLDLLAAITNGDLSAYSKEDAGFDLSWRIAFDSKMQSSIEIRAARTPSIQGSEPRTDIDHLTDGKPFGERKYFDDNWSVVFFADNAEVGRIDVHGTNGTGRRKDGEK
jgi:AAA15 family ATPase/GTPase